MNNVFGKLLYGGFFVFVVPALLMLWADGLDQAVAGIPAAGTPAMGWMLLTVGVCAVVAGWAALIRYGRGLPMNAFPPEVLVQQGIYAVTPHPIYIGFTLLTAGYFMLVGSGAGFWLVAPCVAIGCAALVLGYERPSMQKRFGRIRWSTVLHLPEANDKMPSLSDRASVYALVYLPWLAVYGSAIAMGPAPDAVEGYFSFEHSLPVIEWTEAVYASCYLFVLAAPLVARHKCDLRRFMLMGLWATVAGGLCFLLFPIMATPRPFEASGLWGKLMLLERSADGPAAAFPAFHVIWAFLAAWLYGRSLAAEPLWYLYASAIALSCVTTGMHSLTDLAGALCVLALVLNGERLWQWTLLMTERVANSWREWRIGPARIIVHGVYAGAGAFVGIALVAHLTGAAHVGYVLFVGLAALLGAGLWGQAVEGSSQLSRPFGYYGAILGGAAGILVATAMGANGWLLAAACSVAAPFVQATGRLRCLVQGCCHGRECAAHRGITFTREQSRVLYLANLGDRPVYPTQLYSMLYNLVIGALLLRAWTLQVPLPFVTGAYFILSSIGRFIEEAYRGEPQTPSHLGLAVYQWLALAGIVTGAVITSVEGELCNSAVQILPGVFAYAAAFALLSAFAMGVDFPESNRRLSRLA